MYPTILAVSKIHQKRQNGVKKSCGFPQSDIGSNVIMLLQVITVGVYISIYSVIIFMEQVWNLTHFQKSFEIIQNNFDSKSLSFFKFHFYLLQLPKKYVSKSIAQFFSSSLINIHKSILIGIECIIIAQMIFYQNRNHLCVTH